MFVKLKYKLNIENNKIFETVFQELNILTYQFF